MMILVKWWSLSLTHPHYSLQKFNTIFGLYAVVILNPILVNEKNREEIEQKPYRQKVKLFVCEYVAASIEYKGTNIHRARESEKVSDGD